MIDAQERREYSAVWDPAGHPVDVTGDTAAELTSWLARSPHGSNGWPLPFLVQQGEHRKTLSADMILETAFEGDDPLQMGTTTIRLPWVSPASRVYLVPIMGPPPDETQVPEHDGDREQRLSSTLDQAIREARRHRDIRFAVDTGGKSGSGEHRSGQHPLPRHSSALQRLIARGQAEIVSSSPALGSHPCRVLIDLPETEFTSWPPGIVGGIARPNADATSTIDMEPGQVRGRFIYRPSEWISFNPLLDGRDPLAVVFFQRVLAQAAARSRTGGGERKSPLYHGFALARWDQAADWKGVGKALARWNRTYSSPEIALATPSDLLTVIEDLHALGRIRSGTVGLPMGTS